MPPDAAMSSKRLKGSTNHLSGLAAESAAERHYCSKGYQVERRRWRGRAGEVDLILSRDDLYTFVEVKRAATFDLAATRLTWAQLARVASAAEEFMGTTECGSDRCFRVDAALVDGTGAVHILENVTLA